MRPKIINWFNLLVHETLVIYDFTKTNDSCLYCTTSLPSNFKPSILMETFHILTPYIIHSMNHLETSVR